MAIAEVAALAGVGVSSVKRWAEHGLLPFLRTAGGHRRFERNQVDRFLRDQQSVAGGESLDTLGGPLTDRWVASLLGQRGQALDAVLMKARANQGAWYLVAEPVAEALVEIGRRWAGGQLTIAEEHRVSEDLHRSFARILATMPLWPEAPVCLLASVEGDDHTLGLTLAELCLREAGWAAQWLGRSTPTGEILREVASGEVSMVALSASAASQDRARLSAIASDVAESCAAEGIDLLLGGSGAWPDVLPSGVRRMRSFRDLHDMAARAKGKP
jgi:excisionase family DNA binding protein